LFEADEVGFVICSKCGAQIRADREWCLRCHEQLVAWKKPEILPSWINAMGGGTLIFAIVGIAAVAVIFYISVDSGNAQPDTPIRRGSPKAAAAVAAPAGVATQAPTSTHIEQVTFADTTRRSSVLIPENDLANARARFEKDLERDPKNADTLNNLGLTLERLGFVDSAVGKLSEAVALDRRNWIYHFNLAHVMSLRQDWNHAASEYAASLEIFADNYAAQYDLAVAYHMSGNEPDAIKAYEKATKMAPGDPAAHLSYAITLDASGRPDDAVSEYRQYLQLVPTARDAAAVSARIQSLSHDS
jgi:tetratricopeptide (TPR) repeat protein/ribosomal protein L40E